MRVKISVRCIRGDLCYEGNYSDAHGNVKYSVCIGKETDVKNYAQHISIGHARVVCVQDFLSFEMIHNIKRKKIEKYMEENEDTEEFFEYASDETDGNITIHVSYSLLTEKLKRTAEKGDKKSEYKKKAKKKIQIKLYNYFMGKELNESKKA